MLTKNDKQRIEEALLNEVSYSKFKSNIKYRNNSEQLHKAVKEAALIIKKLDKIIEHTSRLKEELCETEESVTYWKNTVKNISKLKEMANSVSLKLNKLVQ